MGTIANFFTSALTGKLRLVIEYIMIGALVALCGIAFTLWVRTNVLEDRVDSQSKTIATLQIADSANQKAIQDLKNFRENDSTTLLQLVHTLKLIAEKDNKAAMALTTLENSNADVKTFLDTPIPDALRKLYNFE